MKKILSILFFCSLKLYAEMPYIIPDYPIEENFKHLDLNKQDLVHKVYTTVPTTNDIGEGQYVSYYDTDGNYRLYTKTNGIVLYTIFNTTDNVSIPVGTVITYVSTTAPAGYLYCNGQSVSTTTYSALFGVIAYQYGGSGGSFSIPDYRGYFLRGMANGSSIDPDRLARKRADGTYGDVVGSTQTDTMQGHAHYLATYSGVANADNPLTTNFVAGADGTGAGIWRTTYDTLNKSVSTPRDDTAHGTPRVSNETRPSNIYVAYHIKY